MRRIACAGAVVLLCGCLRGGFAPPAAQPIPGGGIAGGPLVGRLDLFALDEHDRPLAGAAVLIDDGSRWRATTDARGHALLRGADLQGPVTLTVSFPGRTITTVVGLDGAALTVVLAPQRPTAPATATCRGVIAGWEDLPPPQSGHLRYGRVMALARDPFGALTIEQPDDVETLFAPGEPFQREQWQLVVAAGAVGLYAAVYDIDTRDTSDSDDDVHRLTHLGLLRGLQLAAGETREAIAIPVVAAAEAFSFAAPALAPGLSRQSFGGALTLADGAFAALYATQPGGAIDVPRREGVLATAQRHLLIDQRNEEQAAEPALSYQVVDAPTTGTAFAPLPMLPPPKDVALDGRQLAFSGPAEATLSIVTLSDVGDGAKLWTVAFLDRAGELLLPQLNAAEATLPTPGPLRLEAAAYDLPDVDLSRPPATLAGAVPRRLAIHNTAVSWP